MLLPTAAMVTAAQEPPGGIGGDSIGGDGGVGNDEVAASALMEHLHVKQLEAVSTTTVASLPSQ